MGGAFSTYGAGFIVIILAFGIAGGIVAKIKGDTVWVWFLISLCMPFIGLLTAILYRVESVELHQRCTGCGRVLKLYDTVCMRCGEELAFPDVALAAQPAPARQPAQSN
jgi:energy-coupling factor transporter transmembrane protein EcfT